MALALPLARECLDMCVRGQFAAYAFRRHHGTWFVARTTATRALLLLAAAKSGRVPVPEGWRGAVGLALETLRCWGGEAPDLARLRDVLERIAEDTQASLAL